MNLRLTLGILVTALAVTMVGCVSPIGHNLPPAERLLEPGPGVGGPGPGVIPPHLPTLPTAMIPISQSTVQLLFVKPESLHVHWAVEGLGQFDSTPLVVPGRQNFPQGSIYQLKLTNVPGREGVELYPTVEVAPVTPRTEAYLAHNAIPIQFTEEDFDQVLAGNFVTKVIYLPDPEFQVMALAGVETLVSTRLDPGVDPIVEADRRGAIMAVIRLGNKDIELPGADGSGIVVPAGYNLADGAAAGAVPLGPSGLMPAYVAGISYPQYGMPITGTPIGLPGPPHVPLGGPAGLQKHVIRNHTHMRLPPPNHSFKMHVRQVPGFSYPAPANRMHIREQSYHPSMLFSAPHATKHQNVK